MYARTFEVAITTATGTGSGHTPVLNGTIRDIRYVKGDFSDGSTFTCTGAVSGKNVWTQTGVNASVTLRPTEAVQDTAGAGRFYNDEADEPVVSLIVLADERLNIVVTSGGNSKTGSFFVTVG